MVDDERNQCTKGQATVNIDRLIVAATPIFSPSAGGRQPCPAVHWGTLAGAIDQGRISASEKAGSAKPGFCDTQGAFLAVPAGHPCVRRHPQVIVNALEILSRDAQSTGLQAAYEGACGRPPQF